MTPSTYQRIVRHLIRQGILFEDDPAPIVANVVRSFLHGRAKRKEWYG